MHPLQHTSRITSRPAASRPNLASGMRRPSLRLPRRSVRATSSLLMLWVLMLAVPVYGSASALFQMLGPVHRHVATAALPVHLPNPLAPTLASSALKDLLPGWVLQPWQTWQAFAHAQSHGGLLQHSHAHNDLERHRHAADDDTVMTLGADDNGSATGEMGAAAAAGGATLPMGTATPWWVPPRVADAGRWSPAAVVRWRNADQRRLDRPPTAQRSA
jgi:hypothetical protein